MVDGPAAGLNAIYDAGLDTTLGDYYLLAATVADFHSRLGNHQEAIAAYKTGIALAPHSTERDHLTARLKLVASAS